jgi:hypothetical protein
MRTNSAGFVGWTGTVTEAAINSTQTHVSRTAPRTSTSTWGDTTSTSMLVCALTLAIQLTCATYVQPQQLEGRLLDRASAAEEQANAATELVAQIHSRGCEALIESRRALKYSYAQAHYTRPGPTWHLLEHLQGRLEAHCTL